MLLYGDGATCTTHTLLGPDGGSALGGAAVRTSVRAGEGLFLALSYGEGLLFIALSHSGDCSWPSSTVGDCS